MPPASPSSVSSSISGERGYCGRSSQVELSAKIKRLQVQVDQLQKNRETPIARSKFLQTLVATAAFLGAVFSLISMINASSLFVSVCWLVLATGAFWLGVAAAKWVYSARDFLDPEELERHKNFVKQHSFTEIVEEYTWDEISHYRLFGPARRPLYGKFRSLKKKLVEVKECYKKIEGAIKKGEPAITLLKQKREEQSPLKFAPKGTSRDDVFREAKEWYEKQIARINKEFNDTRLTNSPT